MRNKEHRKEYMKEYRKRKAIEIKKSKIIWNKNNKEKIKKHSENDRKKNKEKIRERKKLYARKKRKEDPLFKLKEGIRVLVKSSFKTKRMTKNNTTINILGCSVEDLKKFIESKFENWMTWENRGLYNGKPNYGWDIDHIIPLNVAKTEDEVIALNHYTNLQPLCSYINRDVKKGKI